MAFGKKKKELFGKIVFDGKIYDLDNMKSTELKDLLDKVEERGRQLEEEFEREMGDM